MVNNSDFFLFMYSEAFFFFYYQFCEHRHKIETDQGTKGSKSISLVPDKVKT